MHMFPHFSPAKSPDLGAMSKTRPPKVPGSWPRRSSCDHGLWCWKSHWKTASAASRLRIMTRWWFEPLWKIWTSIGMIRNPIYGKIKFMANQTTNQMKFEQLFEQQKSSWWSQNRGFIWSIPWERFFQWAVCSKSLYYSIFSWLAQISGFPLSWIVIIPNVYKG